MLYLMVFLGGGLGSVCRYGIGHLFRTWGGHFPAATFLANILSCLLLGWLLGWHLKHPMPDMNRVFLFTGFCGGFSTFSTFSSEFFFLLEEGQLGYAFGYVAASLLAGLFFIFAGLKLA